MLISPDEVKQALDAHGIAITGVLHIGAHDCEELGVYASLGVPANRIVWVDAIPSKVRSATARGIPNVYHAVMTDRDDVDVAFHVANNGQSSSVLELGTHAYEHPEVVYVGTLRLRSSTVDRFMQRNKLDASMYSFWNLDIQGAELLALKGGSQSLKHATALYLEVNEAELYKHCGLISDLDAYLSGFKRVITRMTPHGWGDALYVRVTGDE